jgi:hypothetical protein
MQYAAPGGYEFREAQAFVEFCVELDSQDDRLQHPDEPKFRARIDASSTADRRSLQITSLSDPLRCRTCRLHRARPRMT